MTATVDMNNALTIPEDELDRRVESHRRLILILVAIVAMTIPAAYFNGRVLLRWGDDNALIQHANALSDVPNQFGEWTLVEQGEPISDYLIEQLELRGTLHRVYEHQQTGQRVALLVLVGPPGPLVRHPPEICYQTRANELLGTDDLTVSVGGSAATLRLLSYQSQLPVDSDFFVAYAFGYAGKWEVPSSPRLAYGGRPFLFKLHALTDLSYEAPHARPEGLADFLSELLPELNRVLMPEAAAATANSTD